MISSSLPFLCDVRFPLKPVDVEVNIWLQLDQKANQLPFPVRSSWSRLATFASGGLLARPSEPPPPQKTPPGTQSRTYIKNMEAVADEEQEGPAFSFFFFFCPL